MTSDTSNHYPMHTSIVVQSAAQLAAVYAVLGGTALASGTVAHTIHQPSPTPAAAALQANVLDGAAPAAATAASENDGKRDAAGTLFDPARHTGSIVKSGLWRMKAGLSRGPNEGEDSPTYVNPNAAPAAAASTTAPAAAADDEDDEFAAFAKANAASAPVAAVERKWTDADLGKLCNQAATKLGDPAPVKTIIAQHVPADATPHSRNVPADKREAFAQAVEKHAGITFAG